MAKLFEAIFWGCLAFVVAYWVVTILKAGLSATSAF